MAAEFCLSVSIIPQGIFNREILRYGASGFTSPPNEGMPRGILTPLKLHHLDRV
jgi:hypothetical protein